MAYLNLGLLAYWVVNTIKYQLKKEGQVRGIEDIANNNKQAPEKINSQLCKITRIMNTQKTILTIS